MTKLLNEQQRQRALEVMQEYLAAPAEKDGIRPQEAQADLDVRRRHLIEQELRPLVGDYLGSQIPLSDFKSQVDSLNKRNPFWGFKGIKGQMFFNLLVNAAEDEQELDQEIRRAIQVPRTDTEALNRITTMSEYAAKLGERVLVGGGTKQGRPKIHSVPFFLSYFWQVQNEAIWPIYYTNSVNVMADLSLWVPTGQLATDYITFKQIQVELAELFSKATGELFDLYGVEHVFWIRGGNPYGVDKSLVKDTNIHAKPTLTTLPKDLLSLPDSYIPPIIAGLPRMARNDGSLQEAARKAGTSLERVFEKSIDAAFRMLGYEAVLLGQGQGRVPDGVAISADDSYAILWDAKVRASGYSMGTDDRAIREYIVTQSREYKRRKALRNIYYAIVSSTFSDDFDDAIRSIKMDTDVNEVCLIEAEALVAIVDAKMRDPRQVTLGPDGLQRLFSDSGRLSEEAVRDMLA